MTNRAETCGLSRHAPTAPGLSEKLCLHDRTTSSHQILAELTVKETQSWQGAPDALAHLHSIWDTAKHCPDNKFPTLSTGYPLDEPLAKKLDQLGEQLGDLKSLSDIALNTLPLDYTSNSSLASLRSRISSAFDKALCEHFRNSSDTTPIDSDTVEASERLKSGSVSSDLITTSQDGHVGKHCLLNRFGGDWMTRSVLLDIEQVETEEKGDRISGCHQHKTY